MRNEGDTGVTGNTDATDGTGDTWIKVEEGPGSFTIPGFPNRCFAYRDMPEDRQYCVMEVELEKEKNDQKCTNSVCLP